MKEENWEKAGGVICPRCREETVRLVNVGDGKTGCPQCLARAREKFSKAEASLEPLLNSKDPRLARRAHRYLMKKMPTF